MILGSYVNPNRLRPVIALVGIGAIVGIAIHVSHSPAPMPPDPVAEVDQQDISPRPRAQPVKSPFNTTAAQAAHYVGNQTCLECHQEIGEDYQRSGHSRTIRPMSEVPFLHRMHDMQWHDTVRDVTFHYAVTNSTVDVSLPQVFADQSLPLDFAFGSGDHAVTFVSLISDQNGVTQGIEHRVSWYAHGDRFDYTPRHEELEIQNPVEYFGRTVPSGKIERCVSCHTTTAAIEGTSIVRMMPNVGCESCHGPGDQHVAAVESGQEDLQIQFQQNTWKPADEIRVCGTCHRTVDEIPEPVIRPDEQRIIRFQSVGLVQSKCYTQSGQALSCSTCHNPHQPARATALPVYEQRCIACHSKPSDQTVCPISADANCVQCHMPPVEIHPGIHFHDHWIRIRSEDKSNSTKASMGLSGEIP